MMKGFLEKYKDIFSKSTTEKRQDVGKKIRKYYEEIKPLKVWIKKVRKENEEIRRRLDGGGSP